MSKSSTKNTYRFKGIEYLSKGEVEVAKFLTKYNIDFEYEFPIAIVEYDKPKLWYPDFYLKEYQIVVEFFGRYNYDKTYKQAAEHKKEVFKRCGIQFVPIYHVNKNWEEYLIKAISSHQETKVQKIQQVMEQYNATHEGFLKKFKSFLVNK